MTINSGRILAVFLVFFGPTTSAAVTSGIVVDNERTVYFTSEDRIWRAESGKSATTILDNIHSHWLVLDAEGGLIGEYSDSAPGTYWRWLEGNVTTIPALEAAQALGTRIDDAPAIPVASAGAFEIVLFDETGSSRIPAKGVLGGFAGDGNNGLYVTAGGQLRQVRLDGVTETLLGARQGYPAGEDTTSDLLGIDIDYRGRVYIADRREQRYLQYDPGRRLTQTFIDGDWRWSVAGIRVDSNEVYVLEFDRLPFSAAARVRRIDPSGEIFVIAETP